MAASDEELSGIITRTDEIIMKASDDFIKALPDIEQEIADQILVLVKDLNIKDGEIIPKDSFNKKIANQVEQKISERLGKTAYFDEITQLISNFDEIRNNAVDLQKRFNEIDVNLEKIGANAIKQWAIDNTIYTLKEAGFKYNVVQPLKESLTRVVVLGGSLADLEKEVVEKSNGILQNYAGGVVRDLFSQYEGVVQTKIQTEYGLDALYYVGGLKKTSRPQCRRWVAMNKIPIKDLPKEIAWAKANGSGFIQETTPSTFAIYRGGWGCHHKAIPTRL